MLPRTSSSTTVLIIEDDAQLRELYRTTLTIAGYAVVAVEDGLDALRRLDADDATPSAVVLDIELPRLGGRDVQRELAAHARTRDIPIIVVSGTDTRDMNPKDFACVLRKPIDPDQLVKAIDACLKRAQSPAPDRAQSPAPDTESGTARAKRFLQRVMGRRKTDQRLV